ncbi:MAG: hypothetical protein WCJ14_02050 [Verrucomicrobiota bacterium]
MIRRCWMIACLGVALSAVGAAQEDPGKAPIARIRVTVYHASDGPVAADKLAAVNQETADRLRKEERLRFKHYRVLGQDTQPLLRSYESWAQPLKPSDEVLVRFEAQGVPTRKLVALDLELWLGRKKIVKTDARLEGDRPLFVLGPAWRDGRLIIAVALAPSPKPAL